MISSSMVRMMSETASTKRAVVISGKRTAPSVFISCLKCLPIDPMGYKEDVAEVGNPVEMYQTMIDGELDVQEGDIFTYNSIDYAIRSVEHWTKETMSTGQAYKRLVIEKVKP